MQLYDYQATSVAAIHAALSANGQALVHLATGLGKTVVMREVVKPYNKQRILFLVHDTDILEQNMERFAELFNRVGEVGPYHGDDKTGFRARIVFATFQTMLTEKEWFGTDAFALILVDECHHAPAETYRTVIDYFRGAKLGASATIERLDGRKVEDVFGQPVISIELPEAMAKGYLTPFAYKVMSDGLNAEALERLLADAEHTRRLSLQDINKSLFIEKRDEEIVRHIKEEASDRKTLVFCRNIDHATRVAKLLGRLAVTTHSGLKRATNNQRLRAFRKGQVQYLVVVNKANEGVDIPDAEVVVFLRATESKTIFLQQLGRTLRKAEGKKQSLVLDFVGSLERLSLVRSMARDVEDKAGSGASEHKTPSVLTVTGDGFDFEFDAKVVSALELFDRLRGTEFYSYTEAQARVQEMGIKTSMEYETRYLDDPMLPTNPERYYAGCGWDNWYVFLGKDKPDLYPTYAEAKAAVQRLGIKNREEYERRFSEDPRLPQGPYKVYRRNGWESWREFFGATKQPQKYPTLTEAKAAVQRLGITGTTTYRRRRKEDPRLPSDPDKFYQDKGWISFRDFFGKNTEGFYKNYSEAQAAVQRLGISSIAEYGERRKEDPRLPSDPNRLYKNKGWNGWPAFWGNKK